MFKFERGFTLIELITILAILGLTAGFLVTNVTGILDSYRLRADVDQVLSLLRKTKQLAVTRSRNYGLELINSSELGIYEVGGTGYLQRIELGEGITATHSRHSNQTVFYPLGNASSGTITFSNVEGSSYQVTISSTGRIRMIKE